ncbi:MAG TPA: hypothetical protein VL992_03255 [Tepidisphaeraceae bacterium]|nr:hypothetical protein [Tepidisphaeraceae bacterium]
MNTSRLHRKSIPGAACVEALEDRRLLSVTLPVSPLLPIIATPTPPIVVPPSATIGNLIHAEPGEAFTAVLGTVPGMKALPAGYTLKGEINWGDGTETSPVTFVTEAGGSIAVEGSHTYAANGFREISVVFTEIPPPGTAAPALLAGRLTAEADVMGSAGGVTVEETADKPFTATVGLFTTTFSESELHAEISWGDGTTSMGTIMAAPTASGSLVPTFVVSGTHDYTKTGSYLVTVIVLASVTPPPAATPTPTPEPPIIAVVADIESVIDVLPGIAVSPAT